MPFRSKAQQRLFEAAAHDPAVAARTGLSQKTARKFIKDSAGEPTKGLPDHVPHKADGGPVKFRW
jgi:hypothetical protein